MVEREDSADGDILIGDEAQAEPTSYVVRIWKHLRDGELGCHGWVEEVQTGRRATFLGLIDLIEVIRGHIGLPRPAGSWRRRLPSRRAKGMKSRQTDERSIEKERS